MRKQRILLTLLVLVFSLSVILSGCGQSSDKTDGTDASADTTMENLSAGDLPVIGIKSGSNTSVTLKNKVGQNITDIAIKASSQEEYGAGLLSASDSFRDNESRVLYYTLEDDKNVTYDIKLSLADGTDCVLHDFPFEDITSCTIWLNGVAYIDYVSNDSDEKISTREMELDRLLAEEEGITVEELKAQEGKALAAATPSPSPSAAVTAAPSNNSSGRTNYSGRTNGGSSYSGGNSGGSSSGNSGGDSGSSSGGDSGSSSGGDSGSSSGGDSGSTIGDDSAYMDDDLSGSTVD